MSSSPGIRADHAGDVQEHVFWRWYVRLAFPLAASPRDHPPLRDGLPLTASPRPQFTEYDAHRVLYPVIMAGATAAVLWWVMKQSRLWERWAFGMRIAPAAAVRWS